MADTVKVIISCKAKFLIPHALLFVNAEELH